MTSGPRGHTVAAPTATAGTVVAALLDADARNGDGDDEGRVGRRRTAREAPRPGLRTRAARPGRGVLVHDRRQRLDGPVPVARGGRVTRPAAGRRAQR